MLFHEPFGGVIPGARGAVLAALLRTGAPLTGREVHRLVGGGYSLWAVQQTLKALVQLGLIRTQIVGRAGVHTVNEDHVAVTPLRALLDPIAALTETVRAATSDQVETVILFGSIARGESDGRSDVDLAVIAPAGWDGGADLEDAVRMRLGNSCDVLVFTRGDFTRLGAMDEPIVRDILADGVPLIGAIPRVPSGIA
jgi:predicted nucleotidyltransferase